MNQFSVHQLGLAHWRDLCSPLALHILHRLHKTNYQAYIVGGAVRDMLLGATPKDIDIVTSATPNQVLALFKRKARPIGKRFVIVHVYGRHGEYIEVSTLRTAPVQTGNANHYGTSVAEDAARRDFTINSLYLDGKTNSVIETSNALSDLQNQQLHFIAPVTESLKEDPVRMLRAIHFVAKLNWILPSELKAHFVEYRHLITQASAGRLLDVVQKLLVSGSGAKAYALLKECKINELLFVGHDACTPEDELLLHKTCKQTDARIQQNKIASMAFLFAVLLWPAYRTRYARGSSHNKSSHQIKHEQTTKIVFAKQLPRIHILAHMQDKIRSIWYLQKLLEQPPCTLLSSHRSLLLASFRAAYDLYVMRHPNGAHKEAWLAAYEQQKHTRPTHAKATKKRHAGNQYKRR